MPEIPTGDVYIRKQLALRRWFGPILVLVGGVLAVVASFAPWIRLSASGSVALNEREYGPWTLLSQGGDAVVPVTLWVFLPFAALAANCAAFLLIHRPRWRVVLTAFALVLAFVCLTVSLLAASALPFALAEIRPAYRSVVDYGTWVAVATGPCVALGAIVALVWK